MTRVDSSERTKSLPVYIRPSHNPVLREASRTTKLRVVFNASCKTHNATFLNDHLLIGPKLQQDLQDLAILLHWRQCYVYITEIEKMFRQILVHPLDTNYQKILWCLSNNALISVSLRSLTASRRRRISRCEC